MTPASFEHCLRLSPAAVELRSSLETRKVGSPAAPSVQEREPSGSRSRTRGRLSTGPVALNTDLA